MPVFHARVSLAVQLFHFVDAFNDARRTEGESKGDPYPTFVNQVFQILFSLLPLILFSAHNIVYCHIPNHTSFPCQLLIINMMLLWRIKKTAME